MTPQRVAIITGAARGLGLAMAERFAAGGRHVCMVDVLPQVEQEAARIATGGGAVQGFVTDISNEDAVRDIVADIDARHGRIDILVNNAGISPKKPDGTKAFLEEIALAEWERVLRVNLTGAFLLCRAVVPVMRRNGWGRIVSMSSQAGRTRALIAGAAYSASKAALMGLTRVIATEVAQDGITANCVAPGRVETPLAKVAGSEANRKFAAEIPMRRLGSPEEIAATVEFLASEAASYISGVTIDVNGGHFMV